MKFRTKSKGRNEKGFTLIELLVITAIIVMLVTVILVSIYSAKTKAADNATYTSMKTTANAAYMCLLTGTPGVRLSTPTDAILSPICMSGGVGVAGYAPWPTLSKNSWIYGSGSFIGDGFFWCGLSNAPAPVFCGNLVDGVCGQSSGSGSFCYGVRNGGKRVWCSQDGCRKDGF